MEFRSPERKYLVHKTIAVLTLIGATSLGACSSEKSNPQPTPQVHLVEKDAAPLSANYSTTIDMRSIDKSIATAYSGKDSPYKRLEQTHPTTGKPTHEFPIFETAPILTITLENDKLTYEDSTPGLIPAERQLLGTINASDSPLRNAMKSGTLHSVKVRAFESKEKSFVGAIAKPIFVSQDATDNRKNNLYYFLPVDNPIEEKVLKVMFSHESVHAALKHTMDRKIEPSTRRTLEKACNTLQKSALEDMQYFGTTTQMYLTDLWRSAPAEIKPHFSTVIKAMKNGTYNQLPVLNKQNAEIPACYIERPPYIVTELARQHGHSEILRTYLNSERNQQILGSIEESWTKALYGHTVYGQIREAAFLPLDPRNEAAGHPEDGAEELEASTTSLALVTPKEFGQKVKSLPKDEQQAVVTVIEMSIQSLKKTAPSDTDRAQLDERLNVFKAALK